MNPIYDFKGQVALVTARLQAWGWRPRMFRRERRLRRAGRPGRRRRKPRQTSVLDWQSSDWHRLRRRRRGAGGRDGRPRGRGFRPARHGVQQCRHPGAAVGRRRRADRAFRARHRGQPAGGLGLHEARVARDARSRERRDRQLLVPGRSRRPPATRSLSRHQARRARNDQERGRRICAARHPHQRGLPRHDRHADGRRHARRSG